MMHDIALHDVYKIVIFLH